MFIWFPMKTENSSASGSAGTLVFMILLIFRNSKLDQWETLLSWPVVQLANTDIEICQIHQQINPLRYLVSRVKLSSWWCSQMQTSEIWQILTKNLTNPTHYPVSRVKVSNWWCSQMQNDEIWQILLKNWTNPMLPESRNEVAIRWWP